MSGLIKVPGINRTTLRGLIERVRRDSGNRMSWSDAREFSLAILRSEMVAITDEIYREERRQK